MKGAYFLPYQERWLRDQSRLKIMAKSRRIGITYVQAYEDVTDAATGSGMDVWFSSADQSAALEYIRYCAHWAKLLEIAAEDLGEEVLDPKSGVAARTLRFANGRRVHGLSSNPKAFRSKGGKLVLDEFAFHPDPDALWKAAAPIVTWGYPVRVISTYNGKGNRYARMVAEAESRLGAPQGGCPQMGKKSGTRRGGTPKRTTKRPRRGGTPKRTTKRPRRGGTPKRAKKRHPQMGKAKAGLFTR